MKKTEQPDENRTKHFWWKQWNRNNTEKPNEILRNWKKSKGWNTSGFTERNSQENSKLEGTRLRWDTSNLIKNISSINNRFDQELRTCQPEARMPE